MHAAESLVLESSFVEVLIGIVMYKGLPNIDQIPAKLTQAVGKTLWCEI
jgi:hypothetical protein